MQDKDDADGPAPQSYATGWRRLVLLGQHRHHPAELLERGLAKRLAPTPKPSRKVTLKASIAELLLVSKLRARNLLGRHSAVPAVAEKNGESERKAVLARYAHILAVTCKNWFAGDEPRNHQPPSPHHQRHL